MGCDVVAFEPQSRLHPLLDISLQLNGFQKKIQVHKKAITLTTGEIANFAMVKGNWGKSQMKEMIDENNVDESTFTEISVPTVRVDDVVFRNVLLMKIDVEGFESIVLQSSERLFGSYNVSFVLVELNKEYTTLESYSKMLHFMSTRGFDPYSLKARLSTEKMLPDVLPEELLVTNIDCLFINRHLASRSSLPL